MYVPSTRIVPHNVRPITLCFGYEEEISYKGKSKWRIYAWILDKNGKRLFQRADTAHNADTKNGMGLWRVWTCRSEQKALDHLWRIKHATAWELELAEAILRGRVSGLDNNLWAQERAVNGEMTPVAPYWARYVVIMPYTQYEIFAFSDGYTRRKRMAMTQDEEEAHSLVIRMNEMIWARFRRHKIPTWDDIDALERWLEVEQSPEGKNLKAYWNPDKEMHDWLWHLDVPTYNHWEAVHKEKWLASPQAQRFKQRGWTIP